MSQGLGATQRALLATLRARRAAHRPELYYMLRDLMPGHGDDEVLVPAEAESWRRASRTLARRGLVQVATGEIETFSMSFHYRTGVAGERRHKFLRLLITRSEWAELDLCYERLPEVVHDYLVAPTFDRHNAAERWLDWFTKDTEDGYSDGDYVRPEQTIRDMRQQLLLDGQVTWLDLNDWPPPKRLPTSRYG